MSGADAFPYPDDEPTSVRNLGLSLNGVAEAISSAVGQVWDGRSSIEARWVTAAGGRAVAEVDAVTVLGDDAAIALVDARAPLDGYATALDTARTTIDGLRASYDDAVADYSTALTTAATPGLPSEAGQTLQSEALEARDGRLSELQAQYDEAIATVRTAATNAGNALGEIAGRISPAPQSLNGDLVRANVLDQLPFMAAHTGTTIIPTDDFILVDTGNGDDDVRVTRDPSTGDVTITINGVAHHFTAEEAEDIVIRTNGGSDVVEVAPDIQLGFSILGGDDNDLVAGADGQDVMLGGEGNDVVVGGHGNDATDGGDGDDVVTDGLDPVTAMMLFPAFGRTVSSRDGGGDDVIVGGLGNDRAFAGDGNDTIDGGYGDDLIYGGGGDDTIDAGADNDQVYAGDGNDRIDGGSGNDYIDGYRGDDTIEGGNGHDVIYAGEGDDTVDAGAGRDYVDGFQGNDTITGGDGNDIVSGGAGDDTLTGGADGDVIYAGAGRDAITDRGGDNVVYLEEQDTADVGEHTQLVTVEIAQVPDNIHIEGSPEFQARVRADLETLASSPVGQQMLQQIGEEGDGFLWFDGDQLTIREHDEPSGLQWGEGDDAVVAYNPNLNFADDGTVPPIIILQHELTHAYNDLSDTFVGRDDDSAYWYTGPDAREAPDGVDADGDGRMTFDEVDRDDDGDIDDDDLDLNGDGTVDGDDGWTPNLERQANGVPVDHDGNPDTPDVPAGEVVDHPDALGANPLREEMGLPSLDRN